MRALAALTTVIAWCFALALTETRSRESISPFLLNVLGFKTQKPVHRIIACAKTLGPTKCLSALSAWRAKNAIDAFKRDRGTQFNLTSDVERFPWEQYTNTTEEQLYSELCSGTEKLLQYRTLKFTLVPGYTFKLDSKGNGTLGVDILRSNEIETARGSMKKKFYNIVPYLLLPGLIMSAILPFVLPAMKLMTIGAVMLNNMAFTGAVFTLLRNNAFNDKYEYKVKYINAGYTNEHLTYEHDDAHSDHYNHYDFKHSGSHLNDVIDDHGHFENQEAVEDIPINPDWTNQHYSEKEYIPVHFASQKYNQVLQRNL
ncbi:uncharacterized protein LOC113512505 [Galleria mellonella]|uniref:Uncharacterized protein LOC113512505 n=1 Tax=Galleria mellonella TaxID=7137 RepID=A0A6J1WM82_GALME|nr:uncharacterized protein LOC113512505 [Galleria mellonella]